MKEGWAEGLSEDCPKCKTLNMAYFGIVLKNNDLELRYKCSHCGYRYKRFDEAPPKVEVLYLPGRPKT